MTRPARLLCALAAAAALCALPASAGATEPWWQVLSGSRPSHLWEADPAEVQEVKAPKVEPLESFGEISAARIEVGGETVGCLGAGEFLFKSADQICEKLTGFPATETPAELAEALEPKAIYDGPVQVTGPAQVGEGPLTVTTTGRWVTHPLVLTPLVYEIESGGETSRYTLGKASAQITSKGSGTLALTLTNLGDAPVEGSSDPVVIEDALPAGIAAYGVFDPTAGAQGSAGAPTCSLPDTRHLRCSYAGTLPSYEAIEVDVLVALQGSPPPGEVSVSGGGAPSVTVSQPIEVSPDPVPYGAERFAARAEEEGGAPTTQAGAHPFQVTNTIQWNAGPMHGKNGASFPAIRREAEIAQPALPRNTRVTFPAGLIGSAIATPTCPMAVFLHRDAVTFGNKCPASSAVGVASVTVIEPQSFGFLRLAVPIFNLPAAYGEPARFGFMPAGTPVTIDTSVDPADSLRITGEVRNVTQVAEVLSATISLWGVPGDPRHDSARGWECAYYLFEASACTAPKDRVQTPSFRMPTSCGAPLAFGAALEPWNAPLGTQVATATATADPLVGCNRVPFDPRISNALTSKLAANPSGYDFELDLPDPGYANPADGAISEAQPKRIEVALPEGVTINASQAEGLATCSQAAYERERYDSKPGEGCPEASKIGTVQSATPLVAEKLSGSLYVATPYENPTHSLIGLYVIVRSPERGILVKQPLEVRPDPRTGQLITVAENAPPVPYDYFKLHFREGGRSPLVTPPGCGTFHTKARFVPYSAHDPEHPDPAEVVERQATFTIDHGVDGGGCPSGHAPFHPGFEAGTENNQAGSYSPFLMHLTRSDGEQDMGRFSFVLPPGVVPKLAGIPYCSEAAIAQAASRQGPHGGAEEKQHPSCPAASQIGHTVAGAGVGNQLTYVPGALYLAGPYHGDPISAVSITPAVAGPFDAGVVVVREALRLNPVTHVGEVDGAASDPIPHLLKGIPLNLRDLRVYADRPQFTLNATSCEPFAASSTIWGEGTALEPLPEHPVDLSSRYQAAGCASLGFKPRLGLKLKGGTRRGAFPALRAVYAPRRHGDANLSRLALTFPDSEFIEQGHFRTICTRVQFKAGAGFGSECPKGSIYGHAKVWTPLLDKPLQGPVYLRSSDHNLPDAVLALHGLVDIEVATRIDSTHGRLRAIVADSPDAPVSHAIVRMQGGQKGLFVNSTNLCVGKHRARVNAKGQNGRGSLRRPAMRAVKCGKAHKKRHRGHHKRAGRR